MALQLNPLAIVPLPICAIPFLNALNTAFPETSVSVNEATEFAIVLNAGDISITCVRHCDDPFHCCVMVQIGTILVPFKEQEDPIDYVKRVIELIENQLQWLQLKKLFERLPAFDSLDIVKEGPIFQIRIKGHELDSKATIQGGRLVNSDLPLRTNGLIDCAFMAQFLMFIQPESGEFFKVRILTTPNGFVGLHEYEEERKVLSLSNKRGVATKFVVKDFSLIDLEKFINQPTDELVVIHTTGTPFAGVIGHLQFSFGNSTTIRVGENMFDIPKKKWTLLKYILLMF
jgi:hypothetical protein